VTKFSFVQRIAASVFMRSASMSAFSGRAISGPLPAADLLSETGD
jgi:hypothetical protein